MEKEYQNWRDNPTMRAWHPEKLNVRSEFTISDINDLNKPWRFEDDGLTVTRTTHGLLQDAILLDARSSCTPTRTENW